MKLSESGIALIKHFEGYREKAYKCQAGVWTCGYGHTQNVSRDTVCTEDEATQWLREDVAYAENAVNKESLNLHQCQFDALVSFVFNLGSGAFKGSTLLRIIRLNPSDSRIPSEFSKWVNVRINGKLTPSEGLKKRRKAEAELYINGDY